ncbi:MAG: hypothetical protein M1449_08075 [Candidatus Thermoplasmatota archaeon]|nr:hypothetical protein [Candidatus Thermoplasmatota archaeon]
MDDLILQMRKSLRLRRKLRALWRSRTVWLGGLVAVGSAIQPQLMDWLRLRLTAEDYALAGVIVGGLIVLLRWVTTKPLEEK